MFIDNKVPEMTKQDRRKMLVSLSNEKKKTFIESNLGSRANILFESCEDRYVSGLTENYIKVHVPKDEKLINEIHSVKLINYSSDMVLGSVV